MTPEETLIEAEAALDAAKAALVALEHPESLEAPVPVTEPVAPVVAAEVPAAAAATEVTEGKHGPMIKNGKLYASVR